MSISKLTSQSESLTTDKIELKAEFKTEVEAKSADATTSKTASSPNYQNAQTSNLFSWLTDWGLVTCVLSLFIFFIFANQFREYFLINFQDQAYYSRQEKRGRSSFNKTQGQRSLSYPETEKKGLSIISNQPKTQLAEREVYTGDITVNSGFAEIVLGANSTLKGDINISSGKIVLMERASVEGKIYTQSKTDIIMAENSKVSGDIFAYGDIKISDRVTIGGKFRSQSGGHFITIGDYVEITQGIEAYTDGITIGRSFKTQGDVHLPSGPGQIKLGNYNEIGGDLKNSSGDILIGNSNKIKGKVQTGSQFIQGQNNEIGTY